MTPAPGGVIVRPCSVCGCGKEDITIEKCQICGLRKKDLVDGKCEVCRKYPKWSFDWHFHHWYGNNPSQEEKDNFLAFYRRVTRPG